jgi:vancomycin resistance protein YoaR
MIKDSSNNMKTPTPSRAWLWPIGIVIFFIILAAGLIFTYQKIYSGKFYRGVTVANIDLSGKYYDDAEKLLQDKIDNTYHSGFNFTYQGHQANINPAVVSPTDPDISYNLITFNLDKTLSDLWQLGREKSWWQNLTEQIRVILANKNYPLAYRLDEYNFQKTLEENFASLEKPGNDAELVLTANGDNYDKAINPEKVGKVFDYKLAIDQLKTNLDLMANNQIKLNLVEEIPQITTSNATPALTLVDGVLAKAPLTIKNNEQTWTLDKKQLAAMLDFTKTGQSIGLGLNQKRFFEYLDKEIVPKVNRPALDAKLNISNGKITEFQGAQEGREINREQTLLAINQNFVAGEQKEIVLVVETTQPKILTKDVNDLGINEIIGNGISDFSGSPVNRRHNIKNGGAILNGVLIKPDEEFSLLTTLGPVDDTTGYLQELVIKGNRTIPEYGGGLCQIGTTIFRAALASGLPIVERQNHSYRVSYYEPAGMDATIYIPRPDVKFINDTGHHILIQTKIDGNELRFEFWGTKDGRTMKYSGQTESSNLYDVKPKIWGLVSPAPTKYVESTDVAVGKQKCTEKAHVGATTEFSYSVTYPNGETKEQTFRSVYKPWQAVCLVGVEKLSTPENETDATAGSTAGANEVVETNTNANSNAN